MSSVYGNYDRLLGRRLSRASLRSPGGVIVGWRVQPWQQHPVVLTVVTAAGYIDEVSLCHEKVILDPEDPDDEPESSNHG